MRSKPRPGRHRAAVALVVLLGAATVGCSGTVEDAAPVGPTVETLPTTTAPAEGCDLAAGDVVQEAEPLPEGVDPGATPKLPLGVDTGYAGSGAGSGNPYLVPGARPVPGPDMPVTTLGPDPLTVVVAAPPNPDVGTPAATPADETTIPAPPTTLPEAATTTVAPSEPTTTTTGLMALADDPGCVSSPGDP